MDFYTPNFFFEHKRTFVHQNWKASGSGNPPSLILALQKITILGLKTGLWQWYTGISVYERSGRGSPRILNIVVDNMMTQKQLFDLFWCTNMGEKFQPSTNIATNPNWLLFSRRLVFPSNQLSGRLASLSTKVRLCDKKFSVFVSFDFEVC